MTEDQFIRQRMPADCAIAALAMFLGVIYEDIARHCTGEELVMSGLPWVREDHILNLFKTPCDVFDRSVMDWTAPAILSVPSLNEAEGVTHSVYWDGQRVWDPQHGREGKASYSNQMARELAVVGIQSRDEKGQATND